MPGYRSCVVITFPDELAPRVTVIVVGLRDAPLLGTCLESIAANVTGPTYEVIIVLNDPTPARAAEVERTVRGARVLSFRANLGFGGAVTVAAERARGEYLVLLNDDCTVKPGWLESLVETEQRHAACAVVGSTLVSAEGRLQEAGAVIWADGVTCHVGEGLEVGFMGFERRVDYCSGGSLLIRKDVWNELGGFHSSFFPAYYEDVDFCLRAAEAGWEVWYQPNSVVRHARSNSTEPTFRQFLWERAHETFLGLWSSALADREPTGALERAVWKAMGSPTRVLVVTNSLSDSSGVLEAIAGDCGMHVSVFATERQPAGVFLPSTARVITDLGAHLDTDGVDFDVVVATHQLSDTLLGRLRSSLPEAHLVTDADGDTWPTVVPSARGASRLSAPRVRDVRANSEPVREMDTERKRELELAAQRRELELLSAYGAKLRERLALHDQEIASLRGHAAAETEHLEAERERVASEARNEAQRLADVTRERDELRRELDAERRRVSYRVAQRVLRGLEWTRVLRPPVGRSGRAEVSSSGDPVGRGARSSSGLDERGGERAGDEREGGGFPEVRPQPLVPLPPDDLMMRIGIDPHAVPDQAERIRKFERIGETTSADISNALPRDIDWTGRRVLDFGCGSGRTLRWMLAGRLGRAQFVGCDIHRSSIEWMQRHYPASIRLYANNSAPPLPEPDASFDLVYSASVFSHLTDWAPWLLEMRRILKPGGRLIASIHGRGLWEMGTHGARGEPWREDETGIVMEHVGASFDHSFGPSVIVSEWWLRSHWGRALEIERFEPAGFGRPDNRSVGQAWVVARRTSERAKITADELTEPSADARELPAAIRAQRLAYQEIALLEAQIRTLLGLE